MGKKLIIKGADFSQVAVDGRVIGILDSSKLELNGITIITGDASYGNYGSANTKRMRVKAGSLVPVELGQSVTLSGLKGVSGSLTALTMCIVIYSSNSSPSASTVVGGSNAGESTNYFNLNSSELADSLTWENNIGNGYLSFCAAIGTEHTDVINLSNYRIQYTVE